VFLYRYVDAYQQYPPPGRRKPGHGKCQPDTIHDLSNLLRIIDIFIPNQDEIEAITGINDPQEAARYLCSNGLKMVIVKLGSKGSFICTEEFQKQIQAIKVKAIDTVGAGDVFNAGFIHGYLQDWPLDACLQFGNSLSSIYVTKINNRFPDLDQVSQVASTYKKIQIQLKEKCF
jgi:sugar/nucleoside kinase (ribokinase family)